MNKLWIKEVNGNTDYYSLAVRETSVSVVHKSKLTEAFIKEAFDKDRWLGNPWGEFLIIKEMQENINPDGIDLPAGTYILKDATPALPTRLEVTHLRNDNYIPLQDATPLLTDIDKFLNAKELYKELQFIYKRGYLLYGEPGTGKTAFIRYLAKQEVFKDAIIVWADGLPPEEMIEALNQQNKMIVFIIEELLTEHGTLNFDMQDLLKFMDGELSLQNCITIATTNYPQFMHKNLADRPSRFDVLYEMMPQKPEVLLKLMSIWLKREVKQDELDINSLSLAHLKECCLLHKFHDISLKEARDRLAKQSQKFKNNFTDKKTFGFGMGEGDE